MKNIKKDILDGLVALWIALIVFVITALVSTFILFTSGSFSSHRDYFIKNCQSYRVATVDGNYKYLKKIEVKEDRAFGTDRCLSYFSSFEEAYSALEKIKNLEKETNNEP